MINSEIYDLFRVKTIVINDNIAELTINMNPDIFQVYPLKLSVDIKNNDYSISCKNHIFNTGYVFDTKSLLNYIKKEGLGCLDDYIAESDTEESVILSVKKYGLLNLILSNDPNLKEEFKSDNKYYDIINTFISGDSFNDQLKMFNFLIDELNKESKLYGQGVILNYKNFLRVAVEALSDFSYQAIDEDTDIDELQTSTENTEHPKIILDLLNKKNELKQEINSTIDANTLEKKNYELAYLDMTLPKTLSDLKTKAVSNLPTFVLVKDFENAKRSLMTILYANQVLSESPEKESVNCRQVNLTLDYIFKKN